MATCEAHVFEQMLGALHRLKQLAIVDRSLRLLAYGTHESHSFDRVLALRCLPREHYSVGTVEHSVRDVRDFSTSRPRKL